MTKLDFAIHLLAESRKVTNETAHRTPVVGLLILLILSRRPDEWMTGTQLAEGISTISSSTVATTTRGAVDAGYLERRTIAGGSHNALEWRITPAGQHVVAKLLTTESPAHAPA